MFYTWQDNDRGLVDRWVENGLGVLHERIVRLFQIVDLQPEGAPGNHVNGKSAELSTMPLNVTYYNFHKIAYNLKKKRISSIITFWRRFSLRFPLGIGICRLTFERILGS